MNEGYFRHPAVHGSTVVFVSEDDLWTVPLKGGIARRLTSGLANALNPAISPDGTRIAFTSREEQHPEIFTMDSSGGPATRLTFMGCNSANPTWTSNDDIVFFSDYAQSFPGRCLEAFSLTAVGGMPQRLSYGPARAVCYGEDGTVVLGRETADPARWKRYRGGLAGQLWVDANGNGEFSRILGDLPTNIGSPMVIGGRVFFISDHEGVGNIYSCELDGSNVKRHTEHTDFYARFASTDGTTIVYGAGGCLHQLNVASGESAQIDVDYRSPRTQRNRKFVRGNDNLADFAIHPDGHSIAVEARGKAFSMALWEQAPRQWGKRNGVRYRHGQWLHDGETFVTVSDEGNEEGLEMYAGKFAERTKRLDFDLGRTLSVVASPTSNQLAITNHRGELLLVDLDTESLKIIDSSDFNRIDTPVWSPDGAWIAYGHSPNQRAMSIKIFSIADKKVHQVTRPDFYDLSPSFDPDGKYLYFLSYRCFDPVYDSHYFELSFPRGTKPMLVTLAKDTQTPLLLSPQGLGADSDKKSDDSDAEDAEAETKDDATSSDEETESNDKPKPTVIDFDGIEDRILALPVPDGRYHQIIAIKDKALFSAWDIHGSLQGRGHDSPLGRLESFDLKKLKHETLVDGISEFTVAPDNSTLIYRVRDRLRAIKAGEKPTSGEDGYNRAGGWIDLNRIRISIDPAAEWRQMLREAWRLQRDQFWTKQMGGVAWDDVLERYEPLVEKISTRLEFSDLMWELQGELGTSHAYEMGGDHRSVPAYPLGHLGADISYDEAANLYRIERVVRGDSWNAGADSPLALPGINLEENATLLGVAGQSVDAETSPQELLVNQAGATVELFVGDSKGKNPRSISVTTLRDEGALRYRRWVEDNRAYVHEKSAGRVGYIHVPDMGARGFSEFHRYLMSEIESEALIIDVRYNGGGNVSALLLEKLARKRIGYGISRWGGVYPYPDDSPRGPLVAITNQSAGSDGDIFSHCFKLMKLGKLVGTRTWGGVIGINPRHALVDGSVTTQPEFYFWFQDVGWAVENYGTDPDIAVEITPQDYASGNDPQLDTALDLMLESIKANPPTTPDFSDEPRVIAGTLHN